jgi:hypothetical protein
MDVFGPFVPTPGIGTIAGETTVEVTITKTPSGIQSDVFIISLRLDSGRTWSYLVGVPQSGGSCP